MLIASSCRLQTARTNKNVESVEGLMSQEDAPGEHLAKQKIAASLVFFNKIVQDSQFHSYKKDKGQNLSDSDVKKQVVRGKCILRYLPQEKMREIFFKDEKYLSLRSPGMFRMAEFMQDLKMTFLMNDCMWDFPKFWKGYKQGCHTWAKCWYILFLQGQEWTMINIAMFCSWTCYLRWISYWDVIIFFNEAKSPYLLPYLTENVTGCSK